ncbi:DUF418 domain-containing protein [Enterovibrio calviensis]|uniref:DUF418 domain-containing protein n=1 Tax=Enterovibrio calviensis TaxID=91359 RepID=UPI0004849906|nr:DUF418 domain-containing protein [Enterovibrio calviensis]
MRTRVTGFDVARALAIFGMVIVNFKIAMNAETGSSLLLAFSALFEGRASALFVILAGVGVTFLTNKAREANNPDRAKKAAYALIKRGVLLVAIGLLYVPIWEADILHFYGFYFLIAAAVFMLSNQRLLLVSVGIMFAFPLLMMVFNYDANWDWDTLTYQHFWTVDGMFRHIVFNGFHPVFPWAAFLVFGMWLGRQDLSQPALRKRLFIQSMVTFVVIEAVFWGLRTIVGNGSEFELTPEEATLLFSTSIIPPLPQYMLSAASSAVMVLITCLYLSDKFSSSRIHFWLNQTGKMSLTLYVAHVIIGLGVLEALGRLSDESIEFSLLSSLVFCIFSVIFSVVWLRFFSSGPLEWLFRKAAT